MSIDGSMSSGSSGEDSDNGTEPTGGENGRVNLPGQWGRWSRFQPVVSNAPVSVQVSVQHFGGVIFSEDFGRVQAIILLLDGATYSRPLREDEVGYGSGYEEVQVEGPLRQFYMPLADALRRWPTEVPDYLRACRIPERMWI